MKLDTAAERSRRSPEPGSQANNSGRIADAFDDRFQLCLPVLPDHLDQVCSQHPGCYSHQVEICIQAIIHRSTRSAFDERHPPAGKRMEIANLLPISIQDQPFHSSLSTSLSTRAPFGDRHSVTSRILPSDSSLIPIETVRCLSISSISHTPKAAPGAKPPLSTGIGSQITMYVRQFAELICRRGRTLRCGS